MPLAMRATDPLGSFKEQLKHFCLKERFHFKIMFIIYEHFSYILFMNYFLFLFLFFYCNLINYYLSILVF